MKHTHTLILITLSFVSCVRADIAPDPIFGGLTLTTPATNESPVALLSESVLLTVNTDNTVNTRAEFILKNEGPTTNLTVGFPHFYTNDFLSFTASVDGEPVLCRTDRVVVHFPSSDDLFGDEVALQDDDKGKTQTTFWEVWDMPIVSQEDIHVVVNYTSKLFVTRELITWENYSPWFKGKVAEDIQEQLQQGHLEYILTTGAHWKGPIGEATIKVDLSALSSSTVLETSPHGALIEEDEVLWVLKDFEPDSNIRLSFALRDPFDKLKTLQTLHNQHPDDWYIANSLADELMVEKLRLYEKCVMTADQLPNFLVITKNEERVHAETIIQMATVLIQAYDKNRDYDGLRRVAPKVLPMLKEFERQLEVLGEVKKSQWHDRLLESLSNAIPICEVAVVGRSSD